MNSEKVISNIKKAIKEHLDNNYAYDMLVNFELDVIDWNSLFEYIDKLQKENAELKKQLEVGKEQYNDLVEEKEELQEQLSSNTLQLEKLKKQVEQYQEEVCILDMRTDENIKYKNQQKEFINYLEDEIYSIEPKGTGINYNCEYDSEADYVMAMQEQSRLNTLKEILQKYKSIIGDDK